MQKPYSEIEQICENHFISTHKRQSDGRFVVELPFRCNPSRLGNSREIAIKRLHAVERKLNKQPALKEAYTDFLQEYQNLSHMTEVTEDDADDTLSNYLPHHAVLKESSITTKLRVVFDASCKTSSGQSLNDILLVGPTIQQDLFSIILRFRQHHYVMTADIAKMYRQILINEKQRDLQRIVWRNNDNEIRTFRLNTVTYGMASAPFLAIRCLHQVAIEHEESYPDASNVILKDFYVDDLLTGDDDLARLKRLKRDIKQILNTAGFNLTKWSAKENSIIDEELKPESITTIEFSDEIKTLGLTWNTRIDAFQYKTNHDVTASETTKRSILSKVAQIFDPLGLVGPVTIRAKILLQHLWKLKISWDDPVPVEIHMMWIEYYKQIRDIFKISIPRHAFCTFSTLVELHCYCDASELAYGTCIYARTIDSKGNYTIRLLCAKSKVAPLKRISLPRLELCGALLLSRLCQQVLNFLTVKFDNIYCWTDSKIVLAWISGEPSQWTTFVANRVSEIQQLPQITKWRHVRSEENPADIISRGICPDQLRGCQLWWEGPSWLKYESTTWNNNTEELMDINEELLERKKSTMTFSNTSLDVDIFSKYSSLTKLKRVIAYCMRFKHNASNPESRSTESLQGTELDNAMLILLRTMQTQQFPREMFDLKSKKGVHATSKLHNLHPFLDSQGLIRVGGRLRNAPITYSQKFPIVLPAKHPLTRLIILDAHHKQLHAGPQALLAAIRLYYWPLSGRNTIRSILRKCIVCFRARPLISEQLMSDLPATRVTPARAFLNTGIDYAGPFTIKISRNKTDKAYLCIFVCFSTKAVHLEIANDLSTHAFLRAFKRFIARRGKCANVYSDNGRNFLGASNELRDLAKLLASESYQSTITTFLANQSINWIFIPPQSPHMGGLWEAAVRSAKTHLKKVVGNTILNFEELYTIFTQVEACLNSRPLCPLSQDPHDFTALTPGHFLIGSPLMALPELDITDVPINRLTRYQLITQMHQHFWNRWSREYLSQLQQRHKWSKVMPTTLQPGTMVLLREDNIPPMHWRLGRIVTTHAGKDGLIRIVDVKTSSGILQRSLPKICILPIED